jgi:hypothetical protein
VIYKEGKVMVLVNGNWWTVEDANDIIPILRSMDDQCDTIADALKGSLRRMNNDIQLMKDDVQCLNSALSSEKDDNSRLKVDNEYLKSLLKRAGIPFDESRFGND